PASTRYHGSYEGGLLEHSLNVYDCLKDYLERPRVSELYGLSASDETIALISLLHDICKVNFYKTDYRNAKNDRGEWEKVPYYTIDDQLPYGHGEKSVYIITGFMRLTREEAFAIRFHMGFSGTEDINLVGRAFEKFPLAYALHAADMEASYFLER
ncbi:MAG: HD domain-containing protein, partial [Huintestinicola sp.]